MQERHVQRDKYFNEQSYTSEKHVIPFISDHISLNSTTEILEIGCGEGGNLKPFLDLGCKVTGIDILETKISNAKKFYASHPERDKLNLVCNDIYNMADAFNSGFDLIIMRDVLEHIYDQEKFLNFAKQLLKPGGKFFLGFPPWQNPFGGHQQMCRNKILSKLPYFHLIPGNLYPALLRLSGEPESGVAALLEIRATRISIGRFKRIIEKERYIVEKKVYWFINPNYEIKFGLKPRKQSSLIYNIPWLRNFFITSCYFLLSVSNEN